MNTKAKKILKVIGIIILVIVLTLAAYIIYLYASYHRIEDNKELQVETNKTWIIISFYRKS